MVGYMVIKHSSLLTVTNKPWWMVEQFWADMPPKKRQLLHAIALKQEWNQPKKYPLVN